METIGARLMAQKLALICAFAAGVLSTGCGANVVAVRGDLRPLARARVAYVDANTYLARGSYFYAGHRDRLNKKLVLKHRKALKAHSKRKTVELLNKAGIPGLSIDPRTAVFEARDSKSGETDAEYLRKKGFTHYVDVLSLANYLFRYKDLFYFFFFRARVVDTKTGEPIAEYTVPGAGFFSVLSEDEQEKAYPEEVATGGADPVCIKLWRAGYQHMVENFVTLLKTGKAPSVEPEHNGARFIKRFGGSLTMLHHSD